MFAGYDDNDDDNLINLIHSEAKSLVDSVLEDSVVVVYNNESSALNPSSSSIQVENNLSEYDEQPLSHEISNEDSSIGQHNVQLPLNHYSNNPSTDHVHISDDISDNFAIKSDYDLIAKSPTIESGMSGKDFEDVDDEYNLNISTMNDNCVVKVENVSNSNFEFDIPVSIHERVVADDVHNAHLQAQNLNMKNFDEDDCIQNEAQDLVDSVLKDTVTHIEDNQSSSSYSSNIFNVQGDTYRHEHNK